MKEIYATTDLNQIMVLRSLLQSAGIESMIPHEQSLEVYPIMYPEEGGIKLMVSDEDEEDAQQIVIEFEAAHEDTDSHDP